MNPNTRSPGHPSVTPNLYTVPTVPSHGVGSMGNGIKPMHINNPNTSSNKLGAVAPSSPSPRPHTPPSNLDLSSDAHLMLSPIEENDGSPYSTSSTNRSSKSSNYPTTSVIFGRKPSPPPPKDDLPPIPTDDGIKRSSRSDETNPNDALRALDNVIAAEVTEEFENETESEDDPYQTISEVREDQAGSARNAVPNHIREYQNGGRRLSKEKKGLMLQKLKSLGSINKSSQATLPVISVTPDGDEGEGRTSGNSSSGSGDDNSRNRSPPVEHTRVGSYDKCTNTEVDDFCNNNTTNLKIEPTNAAPPIPNGDGERGAGGPGEVFV